VTVAGERPENGRMVTRYRLLDKVGEGGMATVYRAQDTQLSREVALKLLHPHLASQEESRRRFQREAHATAKLRHPHILEIYDYSGYESPESFIVTEYIEGRNLRTFLDQNPVTLPEVAALVGVALGEALGHAHGLGVIHRDIKPDNVMVSVKGELKLMDFGIAQIVETERMTVTGQLIGSPAYMSPEQVDGRGIDRRSDLFSLGTLVYQLATGVLPFSGKNPHQLLKRIADGVYQDPRQVNPAIDDELARIIGRLLERDLDQRYPDAAALVQDLRAHLREAGVDDPEAALRLLLKDPEPEQARLKARVIERLLEQARADIQARRLVPALSRLSRVLSLDPKHAEVPALLAGLERWQRQRAMLRRAAVAATALAVAMVALLGTRALRSERVAQVHLDSAIAGPARVRFEAIPGLPAPDVLDADAGAAAGGGDSGELIAAAAATDGAAAGDAAGDTAAAGRERPSTVAAAVAAMKRVALRQTAPRPVEVRRVPPTPPLALRRVRLIPAPPAVRVFLDGRPLGWYGADVRHLDLAEGPHQLRLENDACEPAVVSIGARDQRDELRVRLRWRSARLIVKGAAGSPVFINGRLRGKAGTLIPVDVPELSEDGSIQVSVRVTRAAGPPLERTVTLRANRTLEVDAS
jgi:serine/threonine-protein kinase